jgi:hypothetical protein
MTVHDLIKRMDHIQYEGFDKSAKMWVYRDNSYKNRIYGLIAGKEKVLEMATVNESKLTKF